MPAGVILSMGAITSVTSSRSSASKTLSSASTLIGRDDIGGATGIIFSMSSGRLASFPWIKAMRSSRTALFMALRACGSLNAWSMRATSFIFSGPRKELRRNRAKFA